MTAFHAEASRPGFIWLDSSDPSSPGSQRSIIASNPIATWTSFGKKGRSTGIINTNNLATFLEEGESAGTIIGYFSYESVSTFELPEFKNVAFHHHKDLPDVWLGIYPTVQMVHPFDVSPLNAYHLTANQTANHDWFVDRVSQIKAHILNGDIYQANLSRPFTCEFSGNPFDLYCQFRKQNPAPYGAYLNTGSAQIMCTSPEQFFKITNKTIQSRPIKGTIGRNPEHADSTSRQSLLQSEKNRSELTMIVDLIRNDLGKLCETGTISVPEPATVESYKQLHHLVATITGTLKPNTSLLNILHALLPGGSITGAPKARAMEIISQLESSSRSIYTGAIGYHKLDGQSEFNIAIRTAYHVNGTVTYHAGCGIVADSDPETEWIESETKSLGFYDCLTQ